MLSVTDECIAFPVRLRSIDMEMSIEISADSKNSVCDLLLHPDQAYKLKLKPDGVTKKFRPKGGAGILRMGTVECVLDWPDGSISQAILEVYVVKAEWESYSPRPHVYTSAPASSLQASSLGTNPPISSAAAVDSSPASDNTCSAHTKRSRIDSTSKTPQDADPSPKSKNQRPLILPLQHPMM